MITRILAGLILGGVGFAAFGIGAAIWMGSVYGSNSGGTEMSSFFTFGPVGGLAGILLGVGVALQFTGGPAGWAKGLTIAGATITGLAVLTLSGLALAHPRPAPKPFSSILVFQIELPAAAVPENPAWGFEGGSISSVEKKCPAETCAFTLVISVDETFTGGSVTLKGGAGEYRFPTDSVDPHLSSEWCDWRSIGDARFRYRVNRY